MSSNLVEREENGSLLDHSLESELHLPLCLERIHICWMSLLKCLEMVALHLELELIWFLKDQFS